jgi:NADH-quinone oxidoreductase subunit L
MLLAVLSIASGYLLSPFSPEQPNFETWTATPILEEATYPFTGDGATRRWRPGHAATGCSPPARCGRSPPRPATVRQDPARGADVAPDLLAIVLVLLLGGVPRLPRSTARACPSGTRRCRWAGSPRCWSTSTASTTFGYRYVVVPVRDKLSAWATYSSNVVIDGASPASAGDEAGGDGTYRVLDQR